MSSDNIAASEQRSADARAQLEGRSSYDDGLTTTIEAETNVDPSSGMATVIGRVDDAGVVPYGNVVLGFDGSWSSSPSFGAFSLKSSPPQPGGELENGKAHKTQIPMPGYGMDESNGLMMARVESMMYSQADRQGEADNASANGVGELEIPVVDAKGMGTATNIRRKNLPRRAPNMAKENMNFSSKKRSAKSPLTKIQAANLNSEEGRSTRKSPSAKNDHTADDVNEAGAMMQLEQATMGSTRPLEEVAKESSDGASGENGLKKAMSSRASDASAKSNQSMKKPIDDAEAVSYISGAAIEKQGRSRKAKKIRSRTFTPSFTGKINNRGDVEQIFDAARRNMCKIITERIDATGSSLVGKGFIFDAKADGGLQRWTEGLSWSRSRPNRYGFQLYNEVEDQVQDNKIMRVKKEGGLLKYTATDRAPGSTLHCVWYTKETIYPKDALVRNRNGVDGPIGEQFDPDTLASEGRLGKSIDGVSFPPNLRNGMDVGDFRTGNGVGNGNGSGGTGAGSMRQYQPFFSQSSTYGVQDGQENLNEDEQIQEFNKAANAAWKFWQRSKRKTPRGGDTNLTGVEQQPYGQKWLPGSGAPSFGHGMYGGGDYGMLDHPYSRRASSAGPAPGRGMMNGNGGGGGWGFNGDGALNREGMDVRAGLDAANMRDRDREHLGQQQMSRLMNQYHGFDDMMYGAGSQMYHPRSSGRYPEAGLNIEDMSRIRREVYSDRSDGFFETQNNSEMNMRSRQSEQQHQQKQKQQRMHDVFGGSGGSDGEGRRGSDGGRFRSNNRFGTINGGSGAGAYQDFVGNTSFLGGYGTSNRSMGGTMSSQQSINSMGMGGAHGNISGASPTSDMKRLPGQPAPEISPEDR